MTEAMIFDGSGEFVGAVNINTPGEFPEDGLVLRHGGGKTSDLVVIHGNKRIEVPCGQVVIIDKGDSLTGKTYVIAHMPLTRIELK